MHRTHRAATAHSELRNHFACRDQLTIVYSDSKKVYSEYLYNSQRQCIMDLSRMNNDILWAEPVKITTIGLSTNLERNVCVAGGLLGEIALHSLDSEDGSQYMHLGFSGKGNMVNHIDINWYANHVRGKPMQAVVAGNDKTIRTLDITTGTWINGSAGPMPMIDGTETGWKFPWAINCTRASPDGRLREYNLLIHNLPAYQEQASLSAIHRMRPSSTQRLATASVFSKVITTMALLATGLLMVGTSLLVIKTSSASSGMYACGASSLLLYLVSPVTRACTSVLLVVVHALFFVRSRPTVSVLST